MEYLDGLNERQRKAVEHVNGPLLIVAGAGAGKTRVITHRILHLIKNGVEPSAILAITFTNKAAKEMTERVHSLMQKDPSLQRDIDGDPTKRYTLNARRFPWMGTFHSLGVQMLRENSVRIGLPKRFAIFDRGDSISAVKRAIRKTDLDPKSFEPGKILSAISREKGNMVTMEQFKEQSGGEYFPSIVAQIWENYENILKDEKALDFDDLLLQSALLLQKETEILKYYQKKWSYIHIDEYQDTNRVQYFLAKMLSESHKNIAVVGDIDQNIYGWRGASIKNILNFEKDFPNSTVVLLEENYRSTQTILAVANKIIEKNKFRREKTLFTKNAEGEKLGLYTAFDESDEANFIAGRSKQLLAEGVSPKEIAVLFRANFQSRALEEAFLKLEIPYQVLGIRFFERKEVKDVLSYVKAALNPESLGDMRRIINVPPRGLGKVTILKIFSGKENELPSGTREKIVRFRRMLETLNKKLQEEKLSEAIKWIVQESGLLSELKKGGRDDEERLENIKELVTFSSRYDFLEDRESALNKFLDDVALQSDQDELKEEKNAVRLMTVHASKGLEFEYVFVSGLEEGLFPHERMSEVQNEADAEEERRLFYVALTRAKKKVFLSYAGVRTIFGARQVTVPSEFIFDIDEEFLQAENYPEGGGKIIYFE